MRKNSGFTLYELMMVIGIIGILSAIAIPNFISWLPKYRLGSAARDLLSLLQHARLVAVKENLDVCVTFFPAQDGYMVFTDFDSDNNQDVNEPTIKSGKMPSGVNLTGTNFDGDRVRFNSRGLANSGGTISVQNSQNDIKKIRVNITGNSRILAGE